LIGQALGDEGTDEIETSKEIETLEIDAESQET
jgi:hypothetical protein